MSNELFDKEAMNSAAAGTIYRPTEQTLPCFKATQSLEPAAEMSFHAWVGKGSFRHSQGHYRLFSHAPTTPMVSVLHCLFSGV